MAWNRLYFVILHLLPFKRFWSILLKQKKYGTDAGENKCSIIMHGSLSAFMSNSNSPVWPPVGLEPEKNIWEYYHSNVLYGNDLQSNLFIWLFLTETSCNGNQELILRRSKILSAASEGCFCSAYKLFIIRILTFSVGQSCNYFLLSYLFNNCCRINPILVLAASPIKHERFTFREWFVSSG